MKIQIAFFILLLCSYKAFPANIPTSQNKNTISEQITIPVFSISTLSTIKIKEIEKTIGRKLKLKEKIAFKVFQWKLKKELSSGKKEGETDRGKTAMILGIIGGVALFIPFLNLLSIPLAILAIIIGNKAKKEDPKNKKARTGVTLGIATLAFIIIIGLIVALVLTLGTFPI